jgi:hypothetical protein
LDLNPNSFDVIGRVCHVIDFVLRKALSMLLSTEVNALSRRGGDQPGTHLGIVFKIRKMFDEPKADSLENVGTIRFRESKSNWNGIDKSPVSNDERFPCLGIPLKT